MSRTKKGHIKRGTRVTVTGFKGKVMNAIYNNDKLIGYRVTNGNGFWVVIPAENVQEEE